MRARDLTGQRFGEIVISHRVPGPYVRWAYNCDCGGVGVAHSGDLVKGKTKACRKHPRGPQPHLWDDCPGYFQAHRRIKALRGRASEHRCVDCGEQAAQWSYIGGCPDEMVGLSNGSLLAYSPNPEFYVPRDVRCHRAHDAHLHRQRRAVLAMILDFAA